MRQKRVLKFIVVFLLPFFVLLTCFNKDIKNDVYAQSPDYLKNTGYQIISDDLTIINNTDQIIQTNCGELTQNGDNSDTIIADSFSKDGIYYYAGVDGYGNFINLSTTSNVIEINQYYQYLIFIQKDSEGFLTPVDGGKYYYLEYIIFEGYEFYLSDEGLDNDYYNEDNKIIYLDKSSYINDLLYTGSEIELTDTDYVDYECADEIIDVGTYDVTMTLKNPNYLWADGSNDVLNTSVNVVESLSAGFFIDNFIDHYIYDGREIYPTFDVYDITQIDDEGVLPLSEDIDYSIYYYQSSTDVGVHLIDITGINGYKGINKTLIYTIEKRDITNLELSYEDLSVQYSPNVEDMIAEFEYDISILYYNDEQEAVYLNPGFDFEIVFDDEIDSLGSYKISIIGIGNYSGVINNLLTVEVVKGEQYIEDIETFIPLFSETKLNIFGEQSYNKVYDTLTFDFDHTYGEIVFKDGDYYFISKDKLSNNIELIISAPGSELYDGFDITMTVFTVFIDGYTLNYSDNLGPQEDNTYYETLQEAVDASKELNITNIYIFGDAKVTGDTIVDHSIYLIPKATNTKNYAQLYFVNGATITINKDVTFEMENFQAETDYTDEILFINNGIFHPITPEPTSASIIANNGSLLMIDYPFNTTLFLVIPDDKNDEVLIRSTTQFLSDYCHIVYESGLDVRDIVLRQENSGDDLIYIVEYKNSAPMLEELREYALGKVIEFENLYIAYNKVYDTEEVNAFINAYIEESTSIEIWDVEDGVDPYKEMVDESFEYYYGKIEIQVYVHYLTDNVIDYVKDDVDSVKEIAISNTSKIQFAFTSDDIYLNEIQERLDGVYDEIIVEVDILREALNVEVAKITMSLWFYNIDYSNLEEIRRLLEALSTLSQEDYSALNDAAIAEGYSSIENKLQDMLYKSEYEGIIDNLVDDINKNVRNCDSKTRNFSVTNTIQTLKTQFKYERCFIVDGQESYYNTLAISAEDGFLNAIDAIRITIYANRALNEINEYVIHMVNNNEYTNANLLYLQNTLDEYEEYITSATEMDVIDTLKVELYALINDINPTALGKINGDEEYDPENILSTIENDNLNYKNTFEISFGNADDDATIYIKKEVKNLEEIICKVSISLFDDGMVVENFNGIYKVKILIDPDLINDDLKICYVDEDGNVEMLKTYIEDNKYLCFETTHFSDFYLVEASSSYHVSMVALVSISVLVVLISVGLCAYQIKTRNKYSE